MAKFVLTDAYVSINGNDLSDHVSQVTINYSADMQDDTTMGQTSHVRLGGLKDWSVDVEFHQDFAAAALDSILFPLVGVNFPVVIRPVKGTAVGTSNPNYSGTAILESYKPLGGSVGDLAKTNITVPGSGTLSRLTS